MKLSDLGSLFAVVAEGGDGQNPMHGYRGLLTMRVADVDEAMTVLLKAIAWEDQQAGIT